MRSISVGVLVFAIRDGVSTDALADVVIGVLASVMRNLNFIVPSPLLDLVPFGWPASRY